MGWPGSVEVAQCLNLRRIELPIGRAIEPRHERQRVLGVEAKQQTKLCFHRQRRFRTHPPRRSDHDHSQQRERDTEHNSDDEPNHFVKATDSCDKFGGERAAWPQCEYAARQQSQGIATKTPSPEWWNGRHDGFKIRCRKACGFKSHLGYQFSLVADNPADRIWVASDLAITPWPRTNAAWAPGSDGYELLWEKSAEWCGRIHPQKVGAV